MIHKHPSLAEQIKKEYESGNQSEAVEILRRFLKTEPIEDKVTVKIFQEIFSWVTEWMKQHETPETLMIRASVYFILKQYHSAIDDLDRLMMINPNYFYAYSLKGNCLKKLKQYERALIEYNKAIEIEPTYAQAYNGRGNVYSYLKNYDKALQDFNKALEIDEQYAQAMNGKGNVYRMLKHYDNAIENYSKAIDILPLHYFYSNRGHVFYDLKQFEEALKDLNKAIKIYPDFFNAYNGRGNVHFATKEYDDAINDYNKAIGIDPEEASVYYNRGLVHYRLENYADALKDFEASVRLTQDHNKYYVETAKSKIAEIRKKLEDPDYDIIYGLIEDIKGLLLFKEDRLTHYTSLSSAQFLILENSLLRLSEGAYLNDTSEGRELFNYLNFHIKEVKNSETIAELFSERPFIGSFVSETKHDDLTLWRMYGKEAQAEAKGCAITVYREKLLNQLNEKINQPQREDMQTSINDAPFIFYKVAYRNNNEHLQKFHIPGGKEEEGLLNQKLFLLQKKMAIITQKKNNADKISKIREVLNGIAYLFKSSEYQYEQEVRLVVSGIGFEKIVSKEYMPPRVYIELIGIVPTIQKITLGPKVERADEWAAAFNYSIKKAGSEAEIIISHLPFK